MGPKKSIPADNDYLGAQIRPVRTCTRCPREALAGALLCASCTEQQAQFVDAFFQAETPAPALDPAEEATLREQLGAAQRSLEMLKSAVADREREVAELEAKLSRRR